MNYKISIIPDEKATEEMKSLASDRECDSFVLLTFNGGEPDARVYGGVTVSMIGKAIAQEDLLMRGAKFAEGIIIAGAFAQTMAGANAAPRPEEPEKEE